MFEYFNQKAIKAVMFAPRGYMTDYLTDEAIRSIKANRNRPFFMFFAPNAIHTPLQATREDYDALPQIKDHRMRVYAAMVRNLDRNVGKLLQTLRDEGLEQDTLIIFTSDNGGAGYIGLDDINKPYRGWKSTFFEGGLQTPFLMKWPKGMPSGQRYPYPVGHIDVFSTIAGAAGAALPTDREIDGVNLLPYVRGEKTERPHQVLLWRSGQYKAVRDGDWKLQSNEARSKVWLHNLAVDPTEKTDLAETVLAPGHRHHVARGEHPEQILAHFAPDQRIEGRRTRHQERQREQVHLADLRRQVDGGGHRHVDDALAHRDQLARLVAADQLRARIDLHVDPALRALGDQFGPLERTFGQRDGPVADHGNLVFALQALGLRDPRRGQRGRSGGAREQKAAAQSTDGHDGSPC